MRSLSSLLSNPPSSRYKPLPSIAANDSPHFTNKTDARCAFHLNEKIINFCRDPHCLLPLCPRCIKIHSEEHNQMGTLPRFEPIDECLAEAHDYFLQIFGSIADLQKTSFDADDAYKNKKESVVREFELAKGYAYEELNRVFSMYEDALMQELAKEDQIFTTKLIEYHDCLAQIMDQSRDSCRKLNSKNLTMEGLITFYSHEPMRDRLADCKNKLKDFTTTKISIHINENELRPIQALIQRYLVIGDSSNSIRQLLNRENEETLDYRSLSRGYFETEDEYERRHFNELDSHETKKIDTHFPTASRNLQSPLDSYSFQKSRSMRRNLIQQKILSQEEY